MKLEQQVCGLENAKRLKELGVKQESLFYWVGDHSNPDTPWTIENWRVVDRDTRFQAWPRQSDTPISAFTVAELGEMLPPKIGSEQYYTGEWEVWTEKEDGTVDHVETADNEADARAKMLIYLLENKLL